MGIPLPVGLIALGVMACSIIGYGDWVAPIGVAVIWLMYRIMLKSCRKCIDGPKQMGLTDSNIDELLYRWEF
jgi:hypothetical protein